MDLGTALLPTARDQPLEHLDAFCLELSLMIQTRAATGTVFVRRP